MGKPSSEISFLMVPMQPGEKTYALHFGNRMHAIGLSVVECICLFEELVNFQFIIGVNIFVITQLDT